jgi:hypothetical protein
MNVEIGAEAAQFPEKEYINVIAFAGSNIKENKKRLASCHQTWKQQLHTRRKTL